MPTKEKEKILCLDDLRHAEYYGMQNTFDSLYAKSCRGEIFSNLMELILSRENILLAYRNIKANKGSMTPGTDKLTIRDIGAIPPDEVVSRVKYIITGRKQGYQPRMVRRKDIPKPYDPTKSRPLGIPCIWDRLIQQCIKQVMEPICEAKFSDNSFGFRPDRSVENAISLTQNRMQLSHLHYVIEFDVKGFFDNVNHAKLIRQIWAMGIRDKHLIFVIKRILKAPIKMPDGTVVHPTKGTPQGGIISPLLANIVLNELDHWIESQWQENPIANKYAMDRGKKGIDKGNGYKVMRKTKLKEMYIVRYADDFRVFCRTKSDAEKTMIAVTEWLSQRLKLEVSQEKTRIVNVKRRYSEFLGFKLKVHPVGGKHVVQSHVSDKQLARKRKNLSSQAKNIATPRTGKTEQDEVRLYNSMVMGLQNYYCIATRVSSDFHTLHRAVMTIFTNRLENQRSNRLVRKGRKLTDIERCRYGKSKMLRFVAGSGEPIYPIGYVKHKNAISIKRTVCNYTPEGRKDTHANLRINIGLMLQLMFHPPAGCSTEYADNRISLFSAQWGKCSVTGADFILPSDVHCHHKIPKCNGGTDAYGNLTLVSKPVHKLIHAVQPDIIRKYCNILSITSEQLKKVNILRQMAGVYEINTADYEIETFFTR